MSPSQSGHIGNQRPVRRVLIIDDHPIVREGLRSIMDGEVDLTICGEAETAREALTAIKNLSPDVVVAEFSPKPGEGIELVREVRAHHPQLAILVLSSHDEAIYAERMLAAGANGYIMKQAASEQFLNANNAGEEHVNSVCQYKEPGNPYNERTDYWGWSAWRESGAWDSRGNC